jgi:predicted transcriptional regulator
MTATGTIYAVEREKRKQFRRDARVAWDHYQATGLHVNSEEADAWLSKLEAGKDSAPPKCRVGP